MKANRKIMPAVCPSCDAEGTFQERACDVEQLFRNESFIVNAECAECRECGFRILLHGQTDALRQKVADAYRMKHGLLTAMQICILRASYGLSQMNFAALLGVGIASVKRWEHCGVQDHSSDQLMRIKAMNMGAWSYRLPPLPKTFSWYFCAVDSATNPGHIQDSIQWDSAWNGTDYVTRPTHKSTHRPSPEREVDYAFAVAA